jgi:uncharacterized damage-inducible protein DinB
MTYYGSKHLADSCRTVRKNTLAIAEEIPADKYAFKAAPGVMSVAEMLAHIATSYAWHVDVHTKHLSHLGMDDFTAFRQASNADRDALTAQGKDAIVRALRERGERFAAFLESLDDGTLAETITFPSPAQPPSKTRFEMLLGVKEHEMHHRGQLMLIMRLLGMVPPLTRACQQMQAPVAQR